MKIIGSKAAAELARKKLGEKAAIHRCGKVFRVGMVVDLGLFYAFRVKGQGKSWSEALKNAGITPPDPLGQVIEKVQQEGGAE
jgi:hypothetical protein